MASTKSFLTQEDCDNCNDEECKKHGKQVCSKYGIEFKASFSDYYGFPDPPLPEEEPKLSFGDYYGYPG